MEQPFSRFEMLIGQKALRHLAGMRVAVFGLGGVGSYAVEALARSGIGALDLVDHDMVSISNLNRQILATHSTVGRYKVDVAEERVRDINPDCSVLTYRTFLLAETAGQFDFRNYDYIVDAVDTVTAKLLLAEVAQAAGVPLISAMGTGNKLHPELLEIADLYDTSVCPLARIMRKECRRRGIEQLKVVYSREEPLVPQPAEPESVESEERAGEMIFEKKRVIPGSAAFVPAAAGLLIAAEVVRDLIIQFESDS